MADEWFADGSEDVVRPYALTHGRTVPNPELDIATQIVTPPNVDMTGLEPEQVKIVNLCRQWHSVAEISAIVKLPIVVVRLMVSDLLDRHIVITGARTQGARPDRTVLLQLLNGLRAL